MRVEAEPSEWRRFLVVALALTASILLVVGIVNYVVDPPQSGASASGRGNVQTDGKVDLLVDFDEQLDFVLVGPSPMQRFDPRIVTEETGAVGFNAAITASPISDAVDIGRWVRARAERRGEPTPHLVYGFAVEAFGPNPNDDRDLGLPGVKPRGSIADRARDRLDEIGRLIQWGNFKRSVRLIADGKADPKERRRAARATTEGGLDGIDPRLREDGYLTSGPFLGPRGKQPLPELREATYQQYRGYYEALRQSGTDRVDPRASSEFETFLREANDAGDEPTIVVLPFARELAEDFGPISRDAYLATLGAYIDDIADEYDFTILSFEDLSQFGFDDSALYDGIHPRPKLADAFMSYLVDEDPLLEPESER